MKKLARVFALSNTVARATPVPVTVTTVLVTAALAAGAGSGLPTARAAEDVTPFPPGEGAAITRQVCTRCHGANLVVGKYYDRESAERYWRTMVGPDLATAQARTVINYLMTVMGGGDRDGPDAAIH